MNRLICWILGHEYFVIQTFGRTSRRVGCKKCKKQWGMNDRVKVFVRWDGEFAEMYEMFGYKIK